jgi:hypothetical protein
MQLVYAGSGTLCSISLQFGKRSFYGAFRRSCMIPASNGPVHGHRLVQVPPEICPLARLPTVFAVRHVQTHTPAFAAVDEKSGTPRPAARTAAEEATLTAASAKLFGRRPPSAAMLDMFEVMHHMGEEKENRQPKPETVIASTQAAASYPTQIPLPPPSTSSFHSALLTVNPMQRAHGVTFRELFHHLTHYPSQIDRTELQNGALCPSLSISVALSDSMVRDVLR